MEMKMIWTMFGLVQIFVWVMLLSGYQAQDTSCLAQLSPCMNYLSSNRIKDPPRSCCDPLKSVIKSNPQCLCNLVSNKGSAAAGRAGINIDEAQELPGRCGQNVNPIACIIAKSPGGKSSIPNAGSRLSSTGVLVAALSAAAAAAAAVQILRH